MTRILVATGMAPNLLDRRRSGAEWCLYWGGKGYNALVNLSELRDAITAEPPQLVCDILDIAIGVFLADIAVLRGSNEAWTRDLHLLMPVRDPEFWERNGGRLVSILHALTKDNFSMEFCAREPTCPELLSPEAGGDVGAAARRKRGEVRRVDCVSALSGGIDSLAGAAMTLRADRKSLFVTHCSGNPELRKSQGAVIGALNDLRPGVGVYANLMVQPRSGPGARFAFPGQAKRETSRRSRSFLFMSLLAAAACGAQVEEAYLCENGVLTVALPLSAGRVGSLSTRSTHPAVVHEFNGLLRAAGVNVTVLNPFLYQTKAELMRDMLRPVLTPQQIQSSMSCWMAGRRHRQCGGCVPCLLRRIAMLASGLPDEAYEMDILTDPEAYRGTDAYGNLIDLLTQAVTIRQHSDAELLMEWPQLLDLATVGVSVTDILAMYRRHAEELWRVVHEHFPAAARLMASVE